MDAELVVGAEAGFATSTDMDRLGDRLESVFSRRDPRPLYKALAKVLTNQTAVAGGTFFEDLGGPPSGKVWDIRQLLAIGGDPFVSDIVQTTVGAPGVGGTVVLPVGANLTGFTITTAFAAAVVTGVVTVTNGAGGVESFELTMTTTGSVLTQSYPAGLAASPATTGAITITVPAIAGGSAYTIVATYQLPVAWYITANANNAPGSVDLVVPGNQFLPMNVVPGSAESIFLHFGDHLVVQVLGLPVGGQATAAARIAEWPDTVPEGRYA